MSMEHQRLSLLDTLSSQLQLQCLSDLRLQHLHGELRRRLSQLVPEDFPLSEWKEAVAYILDLPCECHTAQQVQAFFLEALDAYTN